VNRYGRGDPPAFAFFEIVPTLAFFMPDTIMGLRPVDREVFMWLLYLALACAMPPSPSRH